MSRLLTEEQKRRLQKVVEDAEKKTSGEIVVYVVKQSDFYEEAFWKLAFLGNLVGLTLVFFLYEFKLIQEWIWGMEPSFLWYFSILVAFSFLGIALGYIPFFRRFFVGKERLDEVVQTKAKEAFLEREVFNTRHRTGILIYVSILEHRVVVLGDSGINQRVKPEDWKRVVQLIIDGIKKNDLASGIEKAIEECGNLLKNSGLAILPDDKNELPNEITEKS
ncbi:MAG: hypothetical protein NZ853_11340 [Leptospiraceae bacterium]|nr:hypothetical protein [Leptospiraceae bacterium]MDW7977152.1 hypothetical protein [Leptospiraceae bacterium]